MTEDIQNKISAFLSDIAEHCESVRFFATYPEGNGETSSYTEGRGNFYAQRGQIHEWLTRQDEIVRAHARKSQDNQDSP